MSSFADIVRTELVLPLMDLLELLSMEGADVEFAWFSGVLNMLAEPDNEEMVLAAVIELSKCAFPGFVYSPEAAARIDALLERAITLSHTMSAGATPQ